MSAEKQDRITQNAPALAALAGAIALAFTVSSDLHAHHRHEAPQITPQERISVLSPQQRPVAQMGLDAGY